MKIKICDRIKQGLETRNLKQSELVEKTGIGKSSISTYISGEYEPKQRNIYKIAEALNVNEAWLMGYDVPMERELSAERLSEEEIQLLGNYNKLNDIGKYEATKRVEELTYINMYTDVKPNYLMPIAAHADDLTDSEKEEMNRRIIEIIEKRKMK